MGLALEMAFRIRKIIVFSIRTCYRLVRDYPFIVGLLCFLILLYRSCPFLFSLLVSSSPVLICTAVLLGTLLSFGQPNIPETETETEEKVSRDVASFRSGVFENDTVVATEDGSFTVERFVGDKVESSFVETGSVEDGKTSEVDDRGGLVDFAPAIHEREREIHFEGEVEQAVERELHTSGLEKRSEIYELNLDAKSFGMDGENAVENQFFLVQSMRNEILEVENRNIPVEPVHKGDDINLSLNANDENHYDSSDSGSDRAESSSPDASMADIIPMLDELHPLLDSEPPQPVNRLNEESDAASEESRNSEGECVMSDDDAENQREGGDVDNDDVDDDGEEEDDDEEEEEEEEEEEFGMQGGKEDESKSAIKWTEDDQKNLMDLGTLELERNQRLENLIARRRARNNLRMLAGKNLIDLDGFDLPVNVPPISTTKRNPFDLPYDSYHDMGLPPIPGSAPSILLLRRNPFDLPYDSNEEKPDLKGDDFEQEFSTSQQKDAFFRRHESFNVGPSSFGIPKQEHQDIKWRPYFMPEKIASEGTSYSPLERQFSEVSASKLSSVSSDTESKSSITDQDDKKPDESQSYLETAALSYLDHATSGIERGSGSWEDVSEDFVQVENRDVHHEVIEITLGSIESHFENQSGLSEIGAADTSMALNANEIHPRDVIVETDLSSNSSLSSLSEVNEKSFEVKTDEVKPSSHHSEESGIPMQASLEDADFKIASEVLDGNQHEEPVYDSSPSAEGKFLSFSPRSSDAHAEITILADTIGPFSGKESEVDCVIGKDDTSSFKDMHATSSESELYAVDRNELESGEVSEVIKHEVRKVEASKVDSDTNLEAQNLSVAPELVVEHVSVDSSPSFSDIRSIEKGIVDDIKDDKDGPSSHEREIFEEVHQIEVAKLGSSPSSDQMSSQSLTFTEPEDQLSSVVTHVSADTGSPSDAKPVEMHATLNDEENPELTSNSSGDSLVEEASLQNDAICHTDQADASTSDRGSEIPTRDLEDMVEMTNYVTTSHEHLTASVATFPGPQEQNPPVVGEQVVVISSSSIIPSELELVEEGSMNEKEVIRSEQDSFQSSSIEAQTEREVLQDVVVKSVTELERDWSDKPMVEPALNNGDEAEESGILLNVSAAEVNSENTTLNVHQDISIGLSSMDSDSTSISSDNPDFKSPNIGEDPKEDNVDEIEREDHEEVAKHLDYLAEAYGSHFSEKTIKEEVDDIAEIDERLLSELDEVGDFSIKEVGDFSIKEVGEPSLEKAILEEAQAERTELRSLPENSNLTETKPELPILEARSIDDINLAFRQLHEGVDVEEIILPSAVEDQVKEEAQAERTELGSLPENSNLTETKPDLPILEARSIDDINLAFRQLHEGVDVEEVILPSAVEAQVKEEAQAERTELGSLPENSNLTETKPELPILEARSIDDINLAFRQLHEGVDVEEVILPSAVEHQVKEEAKVDTVLDLEVVEARSLEDIHVALVQGSEKNIGELPTSSSSIDRSADVVEPPVSDSAVEIDSSNTTDVDKPAHIIDEKSAQPDVTVSNIKDKKAKSGKSKSGSSSSSSSSSSDSD